MPILTRLMAMLTAVGLMAGCASSPSPTKETFLQYAGPPIQSFTYLTHYRSFRSLGGQDVVIWTTINDAYLIKVLEPCIDLPYTGKIELTSESRTVTRGIDAVLVGPARCRIDTIRYIDYGAMKKAGLAGP
jgi:Family of unknown function (DUF6491)